MKKECFKCKKTKHLSDFYTHKRMKDGHLNKCKECTKKDVKTDYSKNIQRPEYIKKERRRGREKYHRLYVGSGQPRPETSRKYIDKYPEKRKAHLSSQHIKSDGKERHHWSYNDDHHRDIVLLSTKHHNKAHRFLVYDQERMMYRRYDTNELLDTKEKHVAFITEMIETQED